MFMIFVRRSSRTASCSLSSVSSDPTSSTEHSLSAQSLADFRIASVSASLKIIKRAVGDATTGCRDYIQGKVDNC